MIERKFIYQSKIIHNKNIIILLYLIILVFMYDKVSFG